MPFKIIYVDDEFELCDLFQDIFSSSDVDVEVFVDHRKALERISSSPPDLLFLDYRLPGTTGDELAHKVAREIPKVLITGDINISPAYSFEEIFHKPFGISEIADLIRHFQEVKLAKA